MPRKQQQKAPKKGEKPAQSQNRRFYIVLIIALILIAAIIIASKTLMAKTSSDFATFKSNFEAAQRIAIYATAYNGTVLTSTVGCATRIIEDIVGSRTAHRNASTIDFYVVNATTCTYSKKGLGGYGGPNYTVANLSVCENLSKNEPTIFLNYSVTNITTIKPFYVYTSGDAAFLNECGIAIELTSR